MQKHFFLKRKKLFQEKKKFFDSFDTFFPWRFFVKRFSRETDVFLRDLYWKKTIFHDFSQENDLFLRENNIFPQENTFEKTFSWQMSLREMF